MNKPTLESWGMEGVKYNENNIASSKLLHKLGFQMEASLRGRRIDRYSGKEVIG